MPAVGTRTDAAEVQREWSRVLWWWVRLVTLMQLSTPLVLVACGMGWLDVRESALIAYIAATNGGTSILTVVGGLVLRPFNTLR